MTITPTYIEYKHLHEWEDDVVLIEILNNETGRVRQLVPGNGFVSDDLPLEEAFDFAHSIQIQDVYTKRIGVFLHKGVEWFGGWGERIKPKILAMMGW
jgi:hypothetical protein